MNNIKSICVFCGSSPGSDRNFGTAARELGRLMAESNTALVYGGSSIGLMRAIADEVLKHNGKVTGVMPQSIVDLDVAYTALLDFRVVDSMSRRKELMAELADAFIAMPGGIGTLDELFEVMSWNQLSIIDKPLALLNTGGYYDYLMKFLEHTVEKHFVRYEHFQNLIVEEEPALLLQKIREYVALKPDSKWIDTLKANTGRII